jgi:formylglycine-generating enzyme required for sulfatase activity
VPPQPPTLVLSIDQGEELFLVEGQQEAKPFVALLRDLVTADAPTVIVLFTIRSDNYERLQLAKELEGVRQQMLSLPPMPRGSYAEVIKGPVQRLDGTPRALRIDDAVVDALLADIEVGGAKDALPLLAFTLERLYGEYGATRHLKLEHYEKLGRIEGAIEAAVERAFRAADADAKVPRNKQERLALLRRGLIPWLAGIDPDNGAPRRRVARLSEIPAAARPLIDLLVEQRLLSTDVAQCGKEITIEPAHEALLRQWGLLQGWLKEDAALLTVLDGIKRAARDWEKSGKATPYLVHTKERLRLGERLLARPDLAANLGPTDRDYVAACRSAERAAQARTRHVKELVGALVVLLVLGGVGWWKQGWFLEQYHWRWKMGPSVLSVEQEKEKAAKPGSDFKECATGCPTMVVVPAGTFVMGSPSDEEGRTDDEGPQHEVTIAEPFAVGKTEVTFAEWDSCIAAKGCPKLQYSPWGHDDQPVINVSWDEAKQYVAWLSRITGKEYRLLTEAEWEHAARAGSSGRYGRISLLQQESVHTEAQPQTQRAGGLDLQPGGSNLYFLSSEDPPGGQKHYSFHDNVSDHETQLDRHAWYGRNSDRMTHPVGRKAANAFGLHDMHGNVLEWVEDPWHGNYEGAPTDGSPWVKETDASMRVVRGGGWGQGSLDLRAANRNGFRRGDRYDYLGFRLARTLHP